MTIFLGVFQTLPVQFVTIDESHAGQRIDNFLLMQLKGVPHSRIYKALRKGEVRVNKGRVQVTYRVQIGDSVRLPPLCLSKNTTPKPSHSLCELLKNAVLFENEDFMVLNKPAGVAVHAGSAVACGVIETLRHSRSDIKNLSLVHRLDRDTSGCLLLAKNRAALLEFQALQKKHAIHKSYLLLVKGYWTLDKKHVKLALTKNKLKSGERMVIADDEGKPSETVFEPVNFFEDTTLLRATLITGRTHQIRVHAAHLGFPIVGDTKYGEREFNRKMHAKRLFLHAEKLMFSLSTSKKPFTFMAKTGDDFEISD